MLNVLDKKIIMGLIKSLAKLSWASLKVAGAVAGKAVDAIDKQADKLAGKIDTVTDGINQSLEEANNEQLMEE